MFYPFPIFNISLILKTFDIINAGDIQSATNDWISVDDHPRMTKHNLQIVQHQSRLRYIEKI